MTDVFLSYKREDQDRVEPLQRALTAAGLAVWWDRDISGGQEWSARIEHELARARCVVVVWSEASTGPKGAFVRDEARRALTAGKLLPVRIDPVDPPVGFGEYQALDLVGWRGRAKDLRFTDVLSAARAMASGEAPPQPRWPVARRRRLIATFTGPLSVGLVLALVLNQAFLSAVCRAPGIGAICGRIGIGHVAGEAELASWAAARGAAGGKGLRTYLGKFPNGVFAGEAQARLATCRKVGRESWKPAVTEVPQQINARIDPMKTEQAARADALARGNEDAPRWCGSPSADWKPMSAESKPSKWTCSKVPGGFRCGFDGSVICKREVRTTIEEEVCAAPAHE